MNKDNFYYCDLVSSITNIDCFCRTFWREEPLFGGEIISSGERIIDPNNIVFKTINPNDSDRWIICASTFIISMLQYDMSGCIPHSYATGKKICAGDLFYISENVLDKYAVSPFITYKESYLETEFGKIKTFLVAVK